jgi:hypothetical protein
MLLQTTGLQINFLSTDETPYGTYLQLFFEGKKLYIDASGSFMALVELGEQVAWLGAACRASSTDTMSLIKPILDIKESDPSCKQNPTL